MGKLLISLPGTKGKIKISMTLALIAIVVVIILVMGLVISVLSSGLDETKQQNSLLQEQITQLQHELAEALKIDVNYVGNKLETISELATAKMTYNGLIHFTEGDIPFINKKEFYMFYRVSIKAGVDVSQAQIQVTNHSVTINLPEIEIFDLVVDEESFQFFDKSTSLFNPETMQDLITAITEAKEDALAQPETQNLKETAKTQIISLITALFEGQIGERDLIINIG